MSCSGAALAWRRSAGRWTAGSRHVRRPCARSATRCPRHRDGASSPRARSSASRSRTSRAAQRRRGLQARDDDLGAAAILLEGREFLHEGDGPSVSAVSTTQPCADRSARRPVCSARRSSALAPVAIGAQPLLGHEAGGLPDEGSRPAALRMAAPCPVAVDIDVVAIRRGGKGEARTGRHDAPASAAADAGIVSNEQREAQKAPARRRPKPGSPRVEPPKPPTQAETSSTCATAAPITCQTGRSRPNG